MGTYSGYVNSIIGLSLVFAMAVQLSSQNEFQLRLFNEISKRTPTKNTVFSPISIETCLAMAYLGADGDTAEEIRGALQLSGNSKEKIAENFQRVLQQHSEGDTILRVANRIYVDEKQRIASKFNGLAKQYFASGAENLNFAESAQSAATINAWIESQTENKIKNLFGSQSFGARTSIVLVNAIYFKGNWSSSFESSTTTKQEFSTSRERKVDVDMMYQSDYFRYGDLKEYDAQVLEMAYQDSAITMVIVLPKSTDGLASLERKLMDVDLIDLSDNLKRSKVDVRLPKFKIEFDVSLKPVLEQLGIKSMFTSRANFESLLGANTSLSVSEVKHKAFIEVNEQGTEAAAATGIKISLESLIVGEVVYTFTADHPFLFVIKDKTNVYFIGHIVDFSNMMSE